MSQYDLAFQEPEIKPGPKYATWDTVPVIITLDNYAAELDVQDPDYANAGTPNNQRTLSMLSKVSFNLEGNGLRGVGCGTLRDVVSIELISATVPVNNAEIFTTLRVNNYSKIKSNNQYAKNAFCILSNENPALNDYYSVKRIGNKPDDNFTYYFPEPTKISTLDIEFISPLGDEVIFADTDAANNLILTDGIASHTYYMLTFEIRMLNSAPKPEARFQNGVAGTRAGPW